MVVRTRSRKTWTWSPFESLGGAHVALLAGAELLRAEGASDKLVIAAA